MYRVTEFIALLVRLLGIAISPVFWTVGAEEEKHKPVTPLHFSKRGKKSGVHFQKYRGWWEVFLAVSVTQNKHSPPNQTNMEAPFENVV